MKKKVLVIADSPLVPSGVGTQTKYMIEALLKTGEYSFFCLAGAIKHRDYKIQKVEPWGQDFLIKPVDGYGTEDIVRSVIRDYRPDILWFMTDPRFYTWLWNIDNEIRKNIPMVYYHVWDNYPYPKYNKDYYVSNDLICTISKVTDDIVKTVAPEVESIRIPHSVNTDIFKNKKDSQESINFRKTVVGDTGRLLFFWNNRNARRKQSGTLIWWFKEFLDEVGQDKATLLMHTEPQDPHGQDLVAIAAEIGLTEKQIMFSTDKLPSEKLASLYSAADCTINIADAEGFGLGTLESLACETPIIVTMTGGLQEQVTDGSEWFGYGIEPSSSAIIGSQEVPYIYEDRISKKDFIESMKKFLNLSPEERNEMGSKGRNYVLKEYGFNDYESNWVKVMNDVYEKHGSWENRKNYKHWSIEEIK